MIILTVLIFGNLDGGYIFTLDWFKFGWEYNVHGGIVRRLENVPTWNLIFKTIEILGMN